MAVKFSGPLFTDPEEAIRKGVRPGLEKLGAQIEATVKLYTPARTGRQRRSVTTDIWRQNSGLTVKATDTRPIRTWLERGTRKGVKLSTANRMWAKGKAKAKEINKQNLMAADIAKELNK
jgi:hypothetical protein